MGVGGGWVGAGLGKNMLLKVFSCNMSRSAPRSFRRPSVALHCFRTSLGACGFDSVALNCGNMPDYPEESN